ncbi:alpha/beta fold hydrolase [Micromonospora sp. ALFpr18c]|uniref:alpha/beta fold hydrolase n=1 Tax=Micromonospora sp. ALFpr18c TaxID=1458665 RepID=UPI00124B031B|nr:alpha/beta fold hydrolase [Micromonospora sp. ALFpr18c]KAB1948986.1 alpha/beta fold hydrolase [Micromonospora sp. ALFpr18c]
MATFVLVPGFWLGAWAWRDVTALLRAQGHDVHPMTLTGVAERDHLATPAVGLNTHTTDIVRLIEVEDLRDVLLVGHSGGGMPVSQAADRIAERIARVVYVESGPLPDGTAQFDTVPPQEQQRQRAAIGSGHLLPPPPWDPAADPTNLAGLDEATLAVLRARTTPHPRAAATDPVRRTGGRPVPTALVASTFPLSVVRQMIREEHPFFTGLADGQLHELPTGHWPMLSEPKALTDVLDLIARG